MPAAPSLTASAERLGSWKEIAKYLNREVRTAQRWERERGLPVHRVPGAKRGGVWASRGELDAWLEQKRYEVELSRPELPETAVLGRQRPAETGTLAALSVLASAPWRLYAAAIPCLWFAAMSWWAHLGGPEQPGWTAIPSDGFFLVEAVAPGSAAARAGLVPGDRIVEWDGQALFGFLRLRLLQAEIGRPYRVTVDRAGAPWTMVITFHQKDWNFWGSRNGIRELVLLSGASLYLLLGLMIAFARPRDLPALSGALALGGIGISLLHISNFTAISGTFAMARRMPADLGVVFFGIASLASGAVPAALVTFLCVFPRKLIRRRSVWVGVWVLNLARAVGTAYWLLFMTYRPETFRGFGWTADATDGPIFPQCLFALAVLIWNAVTLKQTDSGRRARVMMAGLAITMCAALPATFFGASPLARRLTPVYEASAFPLVLSSFYPVFAISVVYAILRHRLFDIRLIVRQGLRYAAARGLLLSVVPLTAVLLAAGLWQQRHQPLAETLIQHRWFYAVLGLGGLLLQWRRNFWLEALDRRFFREQYDARRLLHTVAAEARRARALHDVAPSVVSQIDAALHPEFSAIMVRRAGDPTFRATAAVRLAPAPIPAASRLIELVRVIERPLEVPAAMPDRLDRQNLSEEAEARLEWVFPIAVGGHGPEALIVLGPKRSEEPYSREDQTLLEALAANLALLTL
jgi:hypothetical protein